MHIHSEAGKHSRAAAASDVNETCENLLLSQQVVTWGQQKHWREQQPAVVGSMTNAPAAVTAVAPVASAFIPGAGRLRGGQAVLEPRSAAEGGLMEWMTLPHPKSDEVEGGVVSISNELEERWRRSSYC